MRRLALVAAVAAPLVVSAEDQAGPAALDVQDKICESFGEPLKLSAAPERERAWFKESCQCLCVPSMCGRRDSRRFTQRMNAALRAEEQARQAKHTELVKDVEPVNTGHPTKPQSLPVNGPHDGAARRVTSRPRT